MRHTKEFFDRLAPNWDSMCSHDSGKIETILNLVTIPENAKILDIATGTGVLVPFLLERNPETIIGVDLSEEMIRRAKMKFDDPRVSFHVCDFYNSSLAEGPFDIAVIYSVYPHFEDKQGLSRKLADELAGGGRFVVAHSENRHKINSRHSGDEVSRVSSGFGPAAVEAANFTNEFDIDIMVDTAELYVISGTKK